MLIRLLRKIIKIHGFSVENNVSIQLDAVVLNGTKCLYVVVIFQLTDLLKYYRRVAAAKTRSCFKEMSDLFFLCFFNDIYWHTHARNVKT